MLISHGGRGHQGPKKPVSSLHVGKVDQVVRLVRRLIQATGLQVLKSFFKVCRQRVSLWPLLMYAFRSVSSEECTMFDGKEYL